MCKRVAIEKYISVTSSQYYACQACQADFFPLKQMWCHNQNNYGKAYDFGRSASLVGGNLSVSLLFWQNSSSLQPPPFKGALLYSNVK